MSRISAPMSWQEEIILNLRGLYSRFGYTNCHVRTFEEYDFYVHNRSALQGEEVLVFADADGHLMALKPDVTMSIVNNIRSSSPGLRRLCYNENVYRIPTGGTGFRESVQTGLECIGNLDAYAVSEVLMLAVKSLQAVSPQCVLNLSHVGITDGILDQVLDPRADRTEIFKAMEQKNLAALRMACEKYRLSSGSIRKLEKLTGLFGTLKDTLPVVRAMAEGEKMKAACWELQEIQNLLAVYGLENQVYLDFSVRGGTDYYSGLVFHGLVDGIAAPVLRGGRYDSLIERMGKQESGIGFAVYLDQLESLQKSEESSRILLLYDETVPAERVAEATIKLTLQGKSVRAEREIPDECRGGQIVKLDKNGVTEIAELD